MERLTAKRAETLRKPGRYQAGQAGCRMRLWP